MFPKVPGKIFQTIFLNRYMYKQNVSTVFLQIHLLFMLYSQKVILMLICARQIVKNKATLSFRLVRMAFADFCMCAHGMT